MYRSHSGEIPMPKFSVSGAQNGRQTSIIIDAAGAQEALIAAAQRGLKPTGVRLFEGDRAVGAETLPHQKSSLAANALTFLPGVGGVVFLASGAVGNPVGLMLGSLLLAWAYAACSKRQLVDAWRAYSRVAGAAGAVGVLGILGALAAKFLGASAVRDAGGVLNGFAGVIGLPGFVLLGMNERSFVAKDASDLWLLVRAASVVVLLMMALKKVQPADSAG